LLGHDASSGRGEGALLLGVAPDVLESEAHELGLGSLGALGLLRTGGSDCRLHDGRAVIGASHCEGDGSSLFGEAIKASISKERAARRPGATGLVRSLRRSRIAEVQSILRIAAIGLLLVNLEDLLVAVSSMLGIVTNINWLFQQPNLLFSPVEGATC
jgi:hypothetical protein